jgi:hypothetical protein
MSRLSPTEIPAAIISRDDLVPKLALLHGAPPGIAESTIALLGFGTRALLADACEPPLIEMSGERPVEISITSAGTEVIAACARAVKAGDYAQEERTPGEDSWATNHEEKLAHAIAAIRSSSREPTPAGRIKEVERDQRVGLLSEVERNQDVKTV